MRVLEIKNNLVKIEYNVNDNLTLSGFVIVEDVNKPYVAQVTSLKTENLANTAVVRLLFTFDSEGVLKNYDGTIPSLGAQVSSLPSNELLDVLPVETPIKLGALAQQKLPLIIDKSIFENNFVICCNKQENINTFVNNLSFQLDALNQKVVIIDVDGEFDNENKFEFGYDFKLPLNYNTLNYIFDHDLGDVDATSKAVIQDIFYEVQEYSKTLPHEFIPFYTFLDVVDAQYRETNIPELVLLKNKLLKYKEENIFALNSVELTDLADEIKNNNITVLNISKVDGDLQRQVISFIYDTMSAANTLVYSFVKLNNYNAGKKLIKRFLESGNIATTFICGYEFKYLQELKQVASNFAFFMPLTTQHDFAAYNTYFSKLNPEEFIAYGDVTQEIPLIVELEELAQEDLQPKEYEEDVNNELTSNALSELNNISDEEELEEETFLPEQAPQEDQPFEDETITFEQEETAADEEIPAEENEPAIVEPVIVEQEMQEVSDDISDMPVENDVPTEDIPQIQPQEDFDAVETAPQDEIFSQNPATEPAAEETEEDIQIVEETASPEIEQQSEEVEQDLSYQNTNVLQEMPHEVDEEQIVRDVDDMLYNKKDVEDNIPPLEDDEEITESDLDMIDSFNNQVQQAAIGEETALNIEPVIVEDADEEPLAPEQNEAQPEIVEDELPIYPANDIPQAVTETFEAGDQVSHPKYGTGVVEKMIKYGNKVLCSINFENIGRRLLDPAISEITKVN